AAVAEQIAGEIVFLGTPAEERGSGKQFMIEDGLFEGVDAALLYHPSDRNQVRVVALASVDVEVTFTGVQSHAAADPWKGKNALDALVLLFGSIGLWRQQLRPEARVHGIVLEGGTAANIIPARTVGRFMLRSFDQQYFEEMKARFRDLVQAAALATGCTGEAVFSGGSRTMKHNQAIGERWAANMAAYGVVEDEPEESFGSTDMGNVSHVCPAIHPYLAICDQAVPSHSVEFRDAAASRRADDTTILAATLVAETAFDLFADPELVKAAWREFAGG
ncbi:MAG: peptidase dimerization domain-containing protein, partial [Chloroflexota bacterium]|nr:peptidase dimerization domain-containing protein [Chloroflexota bacterium]